VQTVDIFSRGQESRVVPNSTSPSCRIEHARLPAGLVNVRQAVTPQAVATDARGITATSPW